MIHQRLVHWIGVLAIVWGPQGLAGEDPPSVAGDDVARLAAEIDRLIAERWEADGITPAPRAEDAEFLRRACLDLTGRIPAAADVRDFRADSDPGKRSR